MSARKPDRKTFLDAPTPLSLLSPSSSLCGLLRNQMFKLIFFLRSSFSLFKIEMKSRE